MYITSAIAILACIAAALVWYWGPNRACTRMGARYLQAQREESSTRAEEIAREFLVQAERARRDRARLVCQGYDMLCTALMAQGRLEEAEVAARRLNQAYERAKLSPAELRPAARTLAHVLLRQHRVDEAEALLRQVQDSAVFRDFPLQRGAVLSDLAALEAERNRPDRAAEWNTRAIHLLEAHQAPERDLAVLYMNRGDNHRQHGNQAAALVDYRRAISLFEPQEPESTTLALLLSNAGVAELDLGQAPDAVRTLRRSVDLWQRVAPPFDPRWAMSCHNLAEALAATREWDEAIVFAQRSLEVKGGLTHPDYPVFHQTLTALRSVRTA